MFPQIPQNGQIPILLAGFHDQPQPDQNLYAHAHPCPNTHVRYVQRIAGVISKEYSTYAPAHHQEPDHAVMLLAELIKESGLTAPAPHPDQPHHAPCILTRAYL